MYHLTLQMTILAIVPGKPKMCLQENLVDCADCGGLALGAGQIVPQITRIMQQKRIKGRRH